MAAAVRECVRVCVGVVCVCVVPSIYMQIRMAKPSKVKAKCQLSVCVCLSHSFCQYTCLG